MRLAGSAFSSTLDGSSSGPGHLCSLDFVRPPNRRKTEIELTLLATGQEGDEASAATGQVVGGGATSEVGRAGRTASSPALGGFSSGTGDPSSTDVVSFSKRFMREIEGTSSATGQVGEEASAATSQAAGGSLTSEVGRLASLSLPGLRIYWPSSQLILDGVKTVEARSYALGYRNIAHPDVEMWLVEAPPPSDAISQGWLLAGDAEVALRPQMGQIVGTVTFSPSHEYGSLQAFRADRKNHRIAEGGHYDWDGTGKRYAWRVSAVRRLAQPVRVRGCSGFSKNRPYTVIFAETSSIDGLPCGEGASALLPSGEVGHRAVTGKRSTPANQGSAASAASPKSSKRLKIVEVGPLAQDQLKKCVEEEFYIAAAAF